MCSNSKLSRRNRQFCFALFAAAVLAIIVIESVNFHSRNLVPFDQPWTSTGSFTKNGEYITTAFNLGIRDRDRRMVQFWGSWSGSDAGVGELHSPVFKAPAFLELFLSGFPGNPGLDIYLERASDHAKFPLAITGNSRPGAVWEPFHWRLPASFRGESVRVVAIDQSRDFAGWLGVSTPRDFSYLALLHQQFPPSLFLLGHILLTFALFLLPGFALASFLIHRWPALLPSALILIVASASALGYLSFYLFFFSNPAGTYFSLFLGLASLFLLALALRRGPLLRNIITQVAEPITLTAAASACYLCFAFLFATPHAAEAGYIDGRFYRATLSGDNVIPFIFAEKIYQRQPLRPFCCGDWLSSDRPPLQTGIFLLQRPAPWVRKAEFDYELLSTSLQCLWICGVWSVLNALGTPLAAVRRALLFLVFSGAVFFNCVYTWPKFLAATFILFALSIVIQRLRSASLSRRADVVMASLCLGLALVSHPSSLYSLIALPILLWRFRRRFSLPKVARTVLLSAPIVLAFVLPWTAYQKFVDPPGDRLIKWHLAGHPALDSLTAWQELRAAYTSHTAAQILSLRLSNLRYLVGDLPRFADTEDDRKAQREYLLQAIGVLNIGFVGLLVLLKKRKPPAIPFAGWILAAVATNLLVWCCLEFGPRMTPLVHASYADFLLLSLGLLGFLLALPKPWIVAASALQLANFVLVWVWSPPYSFASWSGPFNIVILQLPLLIFGAVLALLVIWRLAGWHPSGKLNG